MVDVNLWRAGVRLDRGLLSVMSTYSQHLSPPIHLLYNLTGMLLILNTYAALFGPELPGVGSMPCDISAAISLWLYFVISPSDYAYFIPRFSPNNSLLCSMPVRHSNGCDTLCDA